MTVETVVVKYAIDRREFTQSQLQNEIVLYGKVISGKTHNPDTYNRAWRRIREKGGVPTYELITEYKGKQKWFKLIPKNS